jgi:hypothetical protein
VKDIGMLSIYYWKPTDILEVGVMRKFDVFPLKDGTGEYFSLKAYNDGRTLWMTFYCNGSADLMHERLEEGRTYHFQGGGLRRKYYNCFYSDCTCPYEMVFDGSFKIKQSGDEKTRAIYPMDYVPLEVIYNEKYEIKECLYEYAPPCPKDRQDIILIKDLECDGTTTSIQAHVVWVSNMHVVEDTAGIEQETQFSIILVDRSGVTIEATLFNTAAGIYENISVGTEYKYLITDILVIQKNVTAMRFSGTDSKFMIEFNVNSKATLV